MRYTFKYISIVFFLLVAANTFGQSALQKAKDLGKQAVALEDQGMFEHALDLLSQAETLDPASAVYPYEMAYSYYSTKQYQRAIDILVKLTVHKDVFARVYQLLGNAYDDNGQNDKAIETYNAGLKIFPKSGELYLESAVIQIGKKEYDKALNLCEAGIKADPAFPSNYYWATRIYCNSTEKVWGMVYGELFINIERNTKRTAEISKLLYDTYKSSINIDTPGKTSVDFSKQLTVEVDPKADVSKFKVPFNLAYGLPVLMAIGNEKVINLESLDHIRTQFLASYHQSGYDKKYPNVLYDYQDEVAKAGHLEAYNYWLLMKGDEPAFDAWRQNNKDKWDKFIIWFNANPIKLSEANCFYRGQY